MSDDAKEMKKLATAKAHCPTCDGERTCDVHGHVYTSWSWREGEYGMDGGVDHSLLQCRGCETVFYLSDSWDSESMDYSYGPTGETVVEPDRTKATYPPPKSKTKPKWLDAIGKIDDQLHEILNELYQAHDNGSLILTAVGMRTALDRGTEVLGIDASKTFAQKLADLQTAGWIGATEHDILEVVTDAGNAAAHRGWSPDTQEVEELLYAMEVFLQRAFIVGKKALGIKANIPPKPSRKNAANASARPAAVPTPTTAAVIPSPKTTT